MNTAIVTGSMGNLGAAVSKAFLSNGYRVYGTVVPGHLSNNTNNEPNFKSIELDLLDEQAASNAVETIVKATGGIDAAVLTVGGFAMGGIAETGSSQVLQQYRLNFETTYNIARPIFLEMKKRKTGRIFLIGSRPGIEAKASKDMVAYGLAKSLVYRLVELLNEEGRSYDIVTSLIVPGTIDTPQNRAAMPDADFSHWVSPAEIADTILFYCSAAARAIREPVIKMYGQ